MMLLGDKFHLSRGMFTYWFVGKEPGKNILIIYKVIGNKWMKVCIQYYSYI